VFDVTRLLTQRLTQDLRSSYERTYGSQDASVPEIASWAADLALENIARSDATYHNVEHTVMVTSVGIELLRCLHLNRGGVSPRDWLHVIVALLCHDIGYVRGICQADRIGRWTDGLGGTIELAPGATDAALMPWHVDRGMAFVRERFHRTKEIDAERVAGCIDYTRFPVPSDPAWHETGSLRGLVRASDLIGQLGDPHYLRKIPALFHELRENHAQQGFDSPADMRARYPEFFERQVQPWIGDAIALLGVTATGRAWISSLDAHVYEAERLMCTTVDDSDL
jgi:hypothetical protein